MATKKNNALGKGLDILIQDKVKAAKKSTTAGSKEKSENDILLVEINKVEPNKDQPRQDFDEDKLLELSDSIKKNGILDPLLVVDKKDYYMIVAGERRWRASKMAGLKKVPVIVRDFTAQQIDEISLIENLQREDLNAIEKAKAFQKLLTDYNLKQDELAETLSMSRTALTNILRLLKLDPRVQQMIVDKMLKEGHARTLLAIEDKEKQFSAAQQVFDEKLNVRDTEKLVKKLTEKGKEPAKNKASEDKSLGAVYADAEEKMKQLFGTKVRINQKNEKSGKIEIEYYSKEELNRIIEMIYNSHE